MNTVEEELANQLAEEIAKEIDFEIMFEVKCASCVKQGWYKIELDTLGSSRQIIDMKKWAEAEGIVERGLLQHNKIWVFKDQNDAIMFRLSWS
jgi:hypothetical protein